jgi:hypothetical protein
MPVTPINERAEKSEGTGDGNQRSASYGHVTGRLAAPSCQADGIPGNASRAIQAVEGKGGFGKYLDTPELINCLRDQAAVVNGGDLALTEAMLMNQATTLQSLFSRLIERGMGCDQIPGIRGESEDGATGAVSVPGDSGNAGGDQEPALVFAKQANVTTGPQQINNGTAVTSRALENESQQTQLSGGNHELLPNARAQGLAGRIDPAMATVGEIHRAEVGSG